MSISSRHSSVGVILLLATLAMSGRISRPVESPSWREADLAQVARNFEREGMNPLYPRIDWRGNGPGYVEMEFPFLSLGMALGSELGMGRDQVGRALSAIFSLLGVWMFGRLASMRLPPLGAIASIVFFALNPLVLELATSIQPEAMLLCLYVSAIYCFLRWTHSGSSWDLTWTAILTAGALLAKASAFVLGPFFLFTVLDKWGWNALRRKDVWLLATSSTLLPLAWYVHAHTLWLEYGNSLGVSNETHLIGMDMLTDPRWLLGIARAEVLYVWLPAGLLLVLLGGLAFRQGQQWRPEVYLLISLGIYYVVIARTSGDGWATYYHVLSVPPASLLIGWAANCCARPLGPRLRALPVIVATLLAGVTTAGTWTIVSPAAHTNTLLLVLLIVAVSIPLALRLSRPLHAKLGDSPCRWRTQHPFLGQAVFAGGLALLMMTGLQMAREARSVLLIRPGPDPLFTCARDFRQTVAEGALILASGGECEDEWGQPVAYNASYMFYWMDKRGFNICAEKQSIGAIEEYAEQGASYFVAEHTMLSRQPGLSAALSERYPVVASCDQATVYRLESTPR